MKYRLFRSSLFAALLGGSAVLAALLWAHGGGVTDKKQVAASPTIAAKTNSPGLMAAKDPVTGQLRAPTAEEMAALQPETKGKEITLRSQRLANGAVVTTLNSSYDLYEIASKGPDGKMQRACVPAANLDALLKAAQNGDLTKKEALDEK